MLTSLSLALVSATASAPLDFHCVAPLEHYGQVRQILAGPAYRVSGEMQPGRLEEIPDPSLPVRIEGNHIPGYARSAGVTLDSEVDAARYVSLMIRPRFDGNDAESVA